MDMRSVFRILSYLLLSSGAIFGGIAPCVLFISKGIEYYSLVRFIVTGIMLE